MKKENKTPLLQIIFDDFILLLFLGVSIYAISYLIWGLIELAWIPPIPEELKQAVLGR